MAIGTTSGAYLSDSIRPSKKSSGNTGKDRSSAGRVRASAKKTRASTGKEKTSTSRTSQGTSSNPPDAGSGSFVHDDIECRLFRSLANDAFFASVYSDSENIIRYVNPCFATMLGYRPDELVGQHISIAHTPEQTAISKQMIDESVEHGSSEPREHWYLRRDGSVFPLLVWCVSVTSADGTATYTAMTGVDISAALQARKEYQTLFDEMLDAFSHVQIIFDDSGTPVNYRYLAVNPAWTKVVGVNADDVIGKTVKEVMPNYDQTLIDLIGKVAVTGEPVRVEVYNKDLDKHFEAVGYRPAPGECAVILQDITERKKAETEAAQLAAQLAHAQRMESVGRLAGGVAHDFNNLLTVILGHVERNLGRMKSNDPLYPDLEEIGQVAERSATLTRQLLAFARSQPASPRVIDLNETVDAILVILRRLIGEDIDLVWRPGRDLASVRIDPTQVDQILANLCVNARDAIEDVGEIVIETANISLDEDFCAQCPNCTPGDYVELAVTDDGSGMDAETQTYLFEPFFTTKKRGQGTGLGLSTIYGVVKQNLGFVCVASEPGVGTTFRIYFPQHLAEPETPPEQVAVEEASHGTETILLVEDEPAILRIVTTLLEDRGYTVLTAATPGEAIRLTEEYADSIDLLLTDVIMPEMNGPALAERLNSGQRNLKCLFMSGYSADATDAHGAVDDNAHFIPKPFSQNELAAKVREALDT